MGLEFRENSVVLFCSQCCSLGHSAPFTWWLEELENPKSPLPIPFTTPHTASLCPGANFNFPIPQPQVVSLRASWLASQREKVEPACPLTAWACKSQNITTAMSVGRGKSQASPDSRGEASSTSWRAVQHVLTEGRNCPWPSWDPDRILFTQLLTWVLTFLFYPHFTIWNMLFFILTFIFMYSYP